MTEIAFPAAALRTDAIAKWARDHRASVDVRTGEGLAAAIKAGVHLARVTVFADTLDQSDLHAAVNMGVGRVVVGSAQQIEILRSVVVQRRQDVVIRMTDAKMPLVAMTGGGDRAPCGFRFDSNESDTAIAAILYHERLNLVGLHYEAGSQDHDCVSYSAAIGQMVAEMAQVRRNHGEVLTLLGLSGGRGVPPDDWAVELPKMAAEIDESLDDACATLRFPRPLVVLSAALAITGRNAA